MIALRPFEIMTVPRFLPYIAVLWYCSSAGSAEGNVKVFGIQKGVWNVPSNDIYLRYTFPNTNKPVNELTLCYRIRFESYVYGNIHISYAITDRNSNALTIFNRKTNIRSWFNNRAQLEAQKQEWPGHPDMWHHLCHVYYNGTYIIYWQGQVFFNGVLNGELPLEMNGTVILGQEQDSLGGGFSTREIFRGDITQIDIWDRPLTPSEVLEMGTCKTAGVGNILSSSVAKFEIFGNIIETVIPLSDLCRYYPSYAVLPEERTFSASTDICLLFNSSQAIPTTAIENDILHQHLILFLDTCVPSVSWKMWIGITDVLEDGIWRNDDTQEVMTYLNFSSIFSTSSTYTNCAEMMENGLWTVDTCEPTAKRCTACYFEKSDFLYLRGLCFDNAHESRFHLNGYADGRPLIRGYYKYVIMWEENDLRWLLRDTTKNLTFAWTRLIDVDGYPIGRHVWQLEKPMCGNPPKDMVTLSLSPCSSNHFMCNSGECVSIHLRCNLRYDCGDGSDEDGCDVVVLAGGYRSHLAPTEASDSILKLVPLVIINRVASVDELNQVIILEYEINLSWKDSRLNFKFLEVSKKGAALSKNDVDKVWRPQYQISNLEGGRVKELHKSIIVRGANNATVPLFNSVDMDITYPGSDNTITISQRYTAAFTCSFELYSYPFDTQVCSIDISLPTDYSGYVEFGSEAGDVKYTGKEKLSLFAIRNARFSSSTDGSMLSATFEMHRQQGVILMSTFLPSVLLLFVSWATLFVKLENLNVRAIMSLTTLLVLYTLFAQLSSSLPKTAAIKLIDIWFFFIIFLLFFNIMLHIFCECVGQSVTRVHSKMLSTSSFNAWNVQFRRPTPEKILLYHRWIVVPATFVIFNFIFWWQVFTT